MYQTNKTYSANHPFAFVLEFPYQTGVRQGDRLIFTKNFPRKRRFSVLTVLQSVAHRMECVSLSFSNKRCPRRGGTGRDFIIEIIIDICVFLPVRALSDIAKL
jgi:hypothetical protein